jgi:alkanesulfonate monooxygenase SsuD/methylene tetrahydromethanopterin reductase-like flavin-dependent oxidoreductase (luciferase family)
VKFGLFYQLPCAVDQSEAVRYQETIEQIIHGDELGFDTAWLAELHFFRQFSIMPGPLFVATAAAQRTRRIRFGTGVTLLPFHHPLRAAAEAATVDILTGGRLDFGVGRGTIAVHFQGFNVNREDSRERFEESLGIIIEAWTRERFAHKGKYYAFPEIAVYPRPLQKPYPPVRIAANSPDTAEFAGRNGYDILAASIINPMPGFFAHVEKYRAAAANSPFTDRPQNVAGLFFASVGDSLAAVREQFSPSMFHYFKTIGEQAMLGDRSQQEGSYAYLKQVRERAMSITWEGVDATMAIFGPPDECIARIGKIWEASKIDQLVCWFNPGGRVPHRQVLETMERFAAKVIPAVRGLGK